MTENRKRVTVSITGQQRAVSIRAPAGVASKRVSLSALPVKAIDPPIYEGDYSFKPTFAGTVLETAGKKLEADITVDSIYVGDVSNTAGGITIYIGGEFSG